MGQLNQSIPYQQLTTIERDALSGVVNEYIIYNTDDSIYEMYDSGSWVKSILKSGDIDSLNMGQYSGIIYYVDDVSGNDSNTGLSPGTGLALKTIGAAIGKLTAGDGIIVKAGTYTENGLNLNINSCQIYFQIGTILAPTSGTALTVSADYCKLEGVAKIDSVNGETGVLITGNFCYINDIRSNCNSLGTIGFDLQGDSATLYGCRCANPTITSFKIQGDKIKLNDCDTGGNTTSIGFWFTNSCDLALIQHCSSRGHQTSGFQVDSGCTGGVIEQCTSGGGDGRWSDADNSFTWPHFAFDNKVYKTTTFTGIGGAQINIFKITGGVEIDYIYGVVTTGLSADVGNIYLDLSYGMGSAKITDIAGSDVSSADVGSLFIKTEIASSVITVAMSDDGQVIENLDAKKPRRPFIVNKDKLLDTYIRLVYAGVGTSGAIHWRCQYQSIANGFVEPA